MKIIIIIIIKKEKKNCAEKMEFGYCPNCIAIQLLHCRQLGRLGRWARRASGRWALGAGRAGAGRWVSGRRALGRVTRRRAAGGRTRGARGMSGRRAGARAATRSRGCCDTAPVRAAMHGLGAPGALARPIGGSCSQFGFLTWAFDSVVFLSRRLDSVHEHCS